MLRMLVAALLAACALAAPAPASAQVRRCEQPDGRTVFTDRQCQEVGAVERLPRGDAATGARMHRGGCSRQLQDLVFEMTTAIDGRDANRLAGVYHWAGLSSDAAYRVLARLDAIANRPLVDIVPVLPVEPEELPAPTPAWTTAEAAPAPDAATRAPAEQASAVTTDDAAPAPPVRTRRAPVALRVEQTLGRSATPSRTMFGLRRHMGCWWLSL